MRATTSVVISHFLWFKQARMRNVVMFQTAVGKVVSTTRHRLRCEEGHGITQQSVECTHTEFPRRQGPKVDLELGRKQSAIGNRDLGPKMARRGRLENRNRPCLFQSRRRVVLWFHHENNSTRRHRGQPSSKPPPPHKTFRFVLWYVDVDEGGKAERRRRLRG